MTLNLNENEFLEYLTLDELNQWMEYIVEEFPDNTDLKQIGTTVNDRPIMGLHLGDKNNNSDKKKIYMGKLKFLSPKLVTNFYLDCGLHAREWISSATCRYFINEVLQANADPNYEVRDSLPYNADDLRGLLDFNW